MDQGAHFYRCDFQVHTPRDRGWIGGEYVIEDERKEYSKSFVKKCRLEDLHAVAITDHHDTVFYNYIKQASLDEKDEYDNPVQLEEQLIVFPGIEISIANPSAQLLLIFDPDIDQDLYNQVPQKLGISPTHHSEAKTCITTQLDLSVLDIFKRLNEVPEFLNRYILLPNVTPGGHKTFLRAGYHTVFSSSSFVGGYLDSMLYDSMRLGDRNKIDGTNREWSSKPIAVFQTSDARRADFSTLGTFSSWVKWSVPSAEAIRQACLSQTCRVSHSIPILPNIFISKVIVSNSKFLGGFELELNNQYNAFIGGRGTGKSSFLEYLRWGLCDPSFEEVEIRSFDKKRTGLIKNTLEQVGGSVTVEWLVGGVRHTVTRYAVSKNIELTIGDHSPRQATLQDVRTLIGIQSYSQKELSTVGVDIDELRRFIETPIQIRLHDIQKACEGVSALIRQNFHNLREKVRISRRLSAEKTTLASLKEQNASIKEQLQGLPAASLQTINNHAMYVQELQITQELKTKMKELRDETNKLSELSISIKESFIVPDTTLNKSLLEQIKEDINQTLDDFSSLLNQSVQKLIIVEGNKPNWEKNLESWENMHQAHTDAYQEAIKQNTEYQQQLQTLKEKDDLIQEKNTLVLHLNEELISLGAPNEDLLANVNQIIDLNMEQRRLLLSQCENLTALSKNLINATLSEGGDIDYLHAVISGVIQGSGINGDKIRRLLELLNNNGNPYVDWYKIVFDIYALWSAYAENEADFVLPELKILNQVNLIESELRRLASKMDAEKIISLLICRFKEKPIFKYQASALDQIDFENASAGQQASALLKVLLSSEGPPLLIDQPEDDLDNEIVAEIASDIWEAKQRRQILFASHNANLVVNGDAELVVHFGYKSQGDQSSGEIKSIGSIDVPQIREAIKSVMEGGERAFKLRQEKYGF